MKSIVLSVIASLAASQAADTQTAIVISEPVDCLQLPHSEVDRLNYSPNYRVKLKPGTSCTFESTATIYAQWDDFWSPFLTVTYGYQSPPADEYHVDWNARTKPCQLAYTSLPYESGQVLYTERSGWPNADPDVCSQKFVLTNGAAAQTDAECTFYTQLSAARLTVSLVAMLAFFF